MNLTFARVADRSFPLHDEEPELKQFQNAHLYSGIFLPR